MKKQWTDVRPDMLQFSGAEGCGNWFPDAKFYPALEYVRRRFRSNLCSACKSRKSHEYDSDTFETTFRRVLAAHERRIKA